MSTSGWRQTLFNKDMCQGSIMYQGTGDLVVKGQLKSNHDKINTIYEKKDINSWVFIFTQNLGCQ